jgi:hypothetical protein
MGGDEAIRKAIGVALANTRALMTLTGEVTLPADRTRRVEAAGLAGWCCALVPSRAGAEGRCMRELAAVPRRERSR